ncbi:MAG: hypothetical protein ABSH01_18535 [Terriglobia bacterium]|jgi:hypothetical protein
MWEGRDTPGRVARRNFIKTLAAFSTASIFADLGNPSLLGHGFDAPRVATPITDVFMDLNHIHKWDQSNGDTWDPFWADDDSLYAFNCDGRGFGSQQRNLAFNQLQGDGPHALNGRIVNSMDDYGIAGKKEADNATWKACGQECIASTFYAFVSRNVYGSDSKDPLLRQTAFNSSLIKSTDKGLTWTRSAAENYKNPMWPGRRFGSPFFVHYGKNGGAVSRDGARQYVYAISPNGFWNDGDDFIIGRVERSKLKGLDASDWTYYTGRDGHSAKNWSKLIAKAIPILSLPAKCGQTPPCYIPSLGVYLTISWYNTQTMTKWFEPNEMRYDFYQAEHPWGPWNLINSHSDRHITGGHFYGPSLCAKFQERKGTEVMMSLFTSGCPFEDVPSGLYKMWEIPLVLRTTQVPDSTLINDDDARITYSGSWRSLGHRGFSDYNDDVHYTTSVNDSLQFTFTGAGIDYLAEKHTDLGDVDVYVDGALKQNVNLRLENFPRLSQVVVFRTDGLSDGPHTIKIVNKSTAGAVLDGFRVYGGSAGPPLSRG